MTADPSWKRAIAAALTVALTSLGAASHGASSTLPRWAKGFEANQARVQSTFGPHVHEDDHWLILHSEVLIEAESPGLFTETHLKAWQNISDEKRALTVQVPFDSATETLTGLTLLKQRGQLWTTHTGKRAGVEVPELPTDFVTADRVKVMKTGEVRPGQRVLGTWKVTSTETFPGERILLPLDAWPVNRFVVRAQSPALLRALGRFEASGSDGYELTGIPAFHRVHDASDLWNASPLMTLPFAFASVNPNEPNWRGAARRARSLFDAALAEDQGAGGVPAHVRKARELTAGLQSVDEKIAALVTFAQSLVYRNVEWGVGAYQPAPTSEILRTGSGDCKAKVLLLSAMLAEIGVESVPVLARLDEPYLDYQGPATTNIFNHMVLATRVPSDFGVRAALQSGVGKGWVLFDPTDPLATFGSPPNRLQGTLALWLDDNGERFDIEFAETADRFRVELDFNLPTAGTAEFRMTIDGASPYASAAKHNSGPDGLVPRLRRYAEESLRLSLPGLQLDDIVYQAPDHRNGREAKVTLIGSVPQPTKALSGELLAVEAPTVLVAHAMGLPHRPLPEPSADEANAMPPDWRVPACCSAKQSWWEARIDMKLPEGWQLAFRPKFADVDNPWLSASVRNEGQTWQTSIRRMRGRFPGLAPAERVADLNTVLNTMRHAFVVRVAGG